MPKLTNIHEAVQFAVLRAAAQPPPGTPRVVCSSKLPEPIAVRADAILKSEGTTINAFLGACLTLLVEDYARAQNGD